MPRVRLLCSPPVDRAPWREMRSMSRRSRSALPSLELADARGAPPSCFWGPTMLLHSALALLEAKELAARIHKCNEHERNYFPWASCKTLGAGTSVDLFMLSIFRFFRKRTTHRHQHFVCTNATSELLKGKMKWRRPSKKIEKENLLYRAFSVSFSIRSTSLYCRHSYGSLAVQHRNLAERWLVERAGGSKDFGVQPSTVSTLINLKDEEVGQMGFTVSTLINLKDEEVDFVIKSMIEEYHLDLLMGEQFGIKAAVRAKRRLLEEETEHQRLDLTIVAWGTLLVN